MARLSGLGFFVIKNMFPRIPDQRLGDRLVWIRTSMPTWTILMLSTLGGFVGACFFGDPGPGQELAVKLDDSGNPVLLVNPCDENARVVRVEVLESKGDIGRDDDEVLWAIESSPGSMQRFYQLGSLPPNFKEIAPLNPPLPPEEDLAVEVSILNERIELRQGFRIAQLETERLLIGGRRYISPQQYEDLDTCRFSGNVGARAD